jgi:hypothetical protein
MLEGQSHGPAAEALVPALKELFIEATVPN